MTVKCCVCTKTRIDDQWLSLDGGTKSGELVSHSYCPTCLDAALAELTAHSETAKRTITEQRPSLSLWY